MKVWAYVESWKLLHPRFFMLPQIPDRYYCRDKKINKVGLQTQWNAILRQQITVCSFSFKYSTLTYTEWSIFSL